MKLFEPIKIGRMRLENRIAMTSLVTRLATEDGFVTDNLEKHYLRIANGGVGMITVEAAAIISRRSPFNLKICDDKYITSLRNLVKRIHKETRTKLSIQLVHFLKLSRNGYRQKVEELKSEEIEQIVADFEKAALRVNEADFDALELHCAHAYTLASFLSLLNRRKDEYGGSLEGRIRIVAEIMQRIKEKVDKELTIGCRINADEFVVGGNTLEQSKHIAIELAKLGVGYVSVSVGGKYEDAPILSDTGLPWPYSGYSGHRCMPRAYMPYCVNVYLAEDIRRALREVGYRVPIIAAGKIPTPDLAESILQKRKADIIGLARPLLCDPEWPRKAKEGKWDEIINCTYCGGCIDKDSKFEAVSCVRN